MNKFELKRSGRVNRGVLVAAATLACGSMPLVASAASSTWTGSGSGVWSDAGDWAVAGIPGAVGSTTNTDVATFPTGITNRLVTLDNSYNLKTVAFTGGAATDNYTISANTGVSLLLTSGGLIQTTGGTTAGTTNPLQTVSAPIVVEPATGGTGAASFSTSTGSTSFGQLLLSGNISGAGTTTNLTFNGGSTGSQTGVISDGGGITNVIDGGSGSGVWTLGGANTYSGTTSFIAGVVLSVSSINSTGAAHVASSSMGAPTTVANGTITFAGGTLSYTGTGETTDRVINMNGAAQITQAGTGLLKFTSNLINTATGTGGKVLTLSGGTGGTGEFAGNIGDNATGAKTVLQKSGNGAWTISGNNTFTGTVTVSAGNLLLGSSTALGSGFSLTGVTTNGTTTVTYPTASNSTPAAPGNTLVLPGVFSPDTYVTAVTSSGGTTTVTLSSAALTSSANNTVAASAQVQVAATLNLNGQTSSTKRIYVTNGATISNSNTTTTANITNDISDQNVAVPGNDTYRLAGAGNMNIAGINGGTANKTGAGTVTITPNAGTINVINLMPSAGIVQMGEANALTSTSTLTMSGGTYGTGGFNQTLTSLADNTATDTIDFGNGASVLTFGSLSSFSPSAVLTINNWTGAAATAGGTDQLLFTDTTNLTPAVLAEINFAGYAPGSELMGNEVVPVSVPEPSSIALIGLSFLGAVYRKRKN